MTYQKWVVKIPTTGVAQVGISADNGRMKTRTWSPTVGEDTDRNYEQLFEMHQLFKVLVYSINCL